MDDLSEADYPDNRLAAVVLAAGMGTRMRSNLPKILHRVAGEPLISFVLDAALGAHISNIIVVVGHQKDQVMATLGASVRFAVQEPQLGTGHALRQGVELLDPIAERIVVLCGDTPLLTSETVSMMISEAPGAAIVLLSAVVPDPSGYGRVVRDAEGRVIAIVEEADATPSQRSITEINSGLYCFDGKWVEESLGKIQKSAKGEFYLTDLVALAVTEGREVRAVTAQDPHEVMGVNDRFQLAEADRALRDRSCRRVMAAGVTVVDPTTTYIGGRVAVGIDTVIQPGTHLSGMSVIGERCEIGPNSIIRDSHVGSECTVVASMLEQCRVADRVRIGPFSHLRPGAEISSDAGIGNFAEVKNSTVGERVQMHHFSYLGDADVGSDTNVGAGTITCNFDGRTRKKYRTKIGKKVFLGSDTLLRAPVELGDGAQTGAGAVVTRNVPAGKLAVGVPARIRQISGEGDGPSTRETEDQEGVQRGS
jgi:bifunctional UDP-N-acetylglucosamine pyrophosphorylase / glucosamine-1-phosphate N-acetyltransferase